MRKTEKRMVFWAAASFLLSFLQLKNQTLPQRLCDKYAEIHEQLRGDTKE